MNFTANYAKHTPTKLEKAIGMLNYYQIMEPNNHRMIMFWQKRIAELRNKKLGMYR